MKARRDGPQGRAEPGRDLGSAQALHVVEHQDAPVCAREQGNLPAQKPELLTSCELALGLAVLRPKNLLIQGVDGVQRDPPAAPVQPAPERAVRDGPHPGVERSAALPTRQGADKLDRDVLGQVLRVLRARRAPQSEAVHLLDALPGDAASCSVRGVFHEAHPL